MGRSALTAVSPGTRTVPGTANPAPDILPHRRGEGQDCVDREYINEADEVQQQSICTSLLPTSAVGVFMQISYFSSVFRLNFISVAVDPSRRSRRQDVKYGNPIRQCRGYSSECRVVLRL